MTPLLAILLGFVALIIITVIAKVVMDSDSYKALRSHLKIRYMLFMWYHDVKENVKIAAWILAYIVLCFVLLFIFNAKTETERTFVISAPFFLYAVLSEINRRR